jgi:hypothetical protein
MREMLRVFYGVASVAMLANGAWMLAAPASWFYHFPDALPDTGPFNPHLVRDLGAAFTVMGLGLAWCVRDRRHCRVVHLGVTAFLVAHALVHLGELLGGHLPRRHWLPDIPFVFMPALLFLALLPAALRHAADAPPPAPSP